MRLPTTVGAPEPRLAARQLGAAKRALSKSQGKGSSGSGTIGAIDKATALSTAAALESDIIHVDDDLPAAPLDSKALSAWLQAVACGKTVAAKQNTTHIGLKGAVKRPAPVRLTESFAGKHKSLTIQLRRILKLPSSKWREVSTGGDTIGDLSGMRSFLVKMQRRPLICGVGGHWRCHWPFAGGCRGSVVPLRLRPLRRAYPDRARVGTGGVCQSVVQLAVVLL